MAGKRPGRPQGIGRIRAAFGLALLLLAGCAPARMPNMVGPEDAQGREPAAPSLHAAIDVGTVQVPEPARAEWKSTVDKATFREAVINSLATQGLLASGPPRYILTVELLGIDADPVEALSGLSITVTSRIAYRLDEATTERTVFTDGVTASWREDFPVLRGGDQVRVATEQAIRKNLRTFLDELEAKPPELSPDLPPADPGA